MERLEHRLHFETEQEMLQVLLSAEMAFEQEAVVGPVISDEFDAPNEGRIIPVLVTDTYGMHISPPYYTGGKYHYDDINEILTTTEEPILCPGWHIFLSIEEYLLPEEIKSYIVNYEEAPCDMRFST